eukprot:Opistho-2@43061
MTAGMRSLCMLLVCVAVSSLFGVTRADNVMWGPRPSIIELTADNFDEVVNGGKSVFVKFYKQSNTDCERFIGVFAVTAAGTSDWDVAKDRLLATARASSDSNAKEYLRIAAAIVREGVEFFVAEERRLSKRADHPHVDGYKRDEAKKRLNVLRAFGAIATVAVGNDPAVARAR